MSINILDSSHKIKTIHSIFEGAFALTHVGDLNHARGVEGFIFILRGSAKYTFTDRQFTVRQSNVIYLSKDSRYKIDCLTNDYHYICINFSFEEDFTAKSDVYAVENAQSYENLFRMADKAWLIDQIERDAQCFSIVYEIYARLLLHQKKQYSPSYSHRLAPVQDYILANFQNANLRVSDLCNICNLSEEQLRRLFKSCYGVSPMHYVNQLRIERAKTLLENETCNQSKIAELCGFSDVYYFGKMFKRICGLPPGKYASMKNDRK